MSTLLIEGGQRLSGCIEVEGNKNSALPLIAACLLTEEECILENYRASAMSRSWHASFSTSAPR